MQDVTDIYSGFAAVYDELMKNDIFPQRSCDMSHSEMYMLSFLGYPGDRHDA